MSYKNLNKIPINITASSDSELTIKCHLNNILNDTMFDYGTPFSTNGKIWWTTFYADIGSIKNFSLFEETFKKLKLRGDS